MPGVTAILRRRVVLLALVMGALTALLLLAPPRPAAASICPSGCYALYNVIYYNDKGDQVGECVDSCDGYDCTGKTTDHFRDMLNGCCCNNGN